MRGGVNIAGEILSFGIFLFDSDGTMFSSDALPLIPPDLLIVELPTFSITSQPLGVNISGTLTSVVPEPGTLSLLVLGALTCMKRRHKRITKTI